MNTVDAQGGGNLNGDSFGRDRCLARESSQRAADAIELTGSR